MEYLKQFKKHFQNNDLPLTVSLWQEYCLSDEVDPMEMEQILQGIKSAYFSKSFGVYAIDGLAIWQHLAPSKEKDEVLKLIYDLQTSNSEKNADFAYSYLKEKYGEIENFAELIRIVGLVDRQDFQGCIRNFELLVLLRKGSFCMHNGGWGVGEVMDISFLRREISIEFDLVSDQKEISFKNAFAMLVPVSSDHFLARRFGDPEAFEDFARANPVDTVKLMLKDLGAMTALEIKDELLDLVIPEQDWSKWWSNVRSRLKKDGEILYPGSIKEKFSLNISQSTHIDRLKDLMEKNPSISARVEIIYSFKRDFSQALKDKEMNEYITSLLNEAILSRKASISEEVEILFILQDMGSDVTADLEEIIIKFPKLGQILEKISIITYKKRFLVTVKKVYNDWFTFFCDLLFENSKQALREFIYDEIVSGGKGSELSHKFISLIKNPESSSFAFIWFFQNVRKNKITEFAEKRQKIALFESLLMLLYHVDVNLKDRALTKKIYTLVTEKRFELVREVFKLTTLVEIKELLLLASKCLAFSSHDKKTLRSLAEVVHTKLIKKSDKGSDLTYWVTKEGYEKAIARIEEIATKETLENAKEIETAREHGDLRENSEYKFAMEKRARLQKEMKSLSKQVKQMQVLSKEDIDESTAGIGVRVALENEASEKKEYIILGSFEADPDKDIISIDSDLAQNLSGKKTGEKVTIGSSSWIIMSTKAIL